MAAFIFSVTDNPPGKDLLDLLNDLFDEEDNSSLQKYIDSESYAKFLQRGVLDNRKIFDLEDQDVDAVFNLAFILFSTIEEKEIDAVALKFSAVLSTQPSQKSSLKLDLLSGLFHFLPLQSPSRPSIMFTILQMTLTCGQSQDILLRLPEIESWSKDWSMGSEQTAELFRLFTEISSQAATNETAIQMYRCKYLAALDDTTNAKSLAQSAPIAADAVAFTLSQNGQQFQTLTHLSAVKNLKKTNPELFQLLTVFATGSVADFNSFASKNKKFFKKSDMDEAALRRSIQSLTICSMVQDASTLTYDQVQQQLSVSTDEEVEEILVNATQAGVVEIKIDQESRTVDVEFAAPRFASGVSQTQDWQKLAGSLNYWRESVHSVLNQLNSMDHTLEDVIPAGEDTQ